VDIGLRRALARAIIEHESGRDIIRNLDLNADGSGHITYNTENVWIDPSAPGFVNGRTAIIDEELVRAYLVIQLATRYGYTANGRRIEVERVYKPVGRPGKGGRIDVLVRGSQKDPGSPDTFLFIECKAPDKFDQDLKLIDGQLFRLSKQETPRPRYLVYFTVELKAGVLRDRLILIDTRSSSEFEDWDAAGQPITDAIPSNYGAAAKRLYGNVQRETDNLRPLDTEASSAQFSRLRNEIHDVIWGGGGTNNNEVFILITRLILAKIYDEKETAPDARYEFQRRGTAVTPETADALVSRLNSLYRRAEDAYLALPTPTAGPAFDTSRVSAEKIAYVVGRLEAISISENNHPGDLLGEFFEQIVSQDFTQTKGQFFTPVKLVRFMLHLSDAVGQAQDVMMTGRDHLGRPRLPYVIDPSCGSGTFLIEYMRMLTRRLGAADVGSRLPRRVKESYDSWFSGSSGNSWARDFLFGIENNYDLGLAAKVNMVLHGDGSMNTWIASGLLPFREYWVEGRHNLVGTAQPRHAHPYGAQRNEQFDLILSNPPFSLRLSPDEKLKIEKSFDIMSRAQSEAVFIERWYQLLREGGKFCCVLPEAVLDTSTARHMRLFLLQYFHIDAVVSLPYDAFRPFTSTKTCILVATKRPVAEAEAFHDLLQKARRTHRGVDEHVLVGKVLGELGWSDQPIFMAEPGFVGYRRRKNLPDLPMPNELYRETSDGDVSDLGIDDSTDGNVLGALGKGPFGSADPKLGFWVSLKDISSRRGYRLDPKYRWLWDHMNGVAAGNPSKAVPLSSILEIVGLPTVPKGELQEELRLIDLEWVESRQALLHPATPFVDVLGSDKFRFENCDLAFSKLEPYLGKVLVQPDRNDLGSTEWVGFRVLQDIPVLLAAYMLMERQLCEAFRRLQSGKRHARLDPEEMLDLRVQVPESIRWDELVARLREQRSKILELRSLEAAVRDGIDALLNQSRR
jgi:type I restriction-modification system DNA methylase subunit